MRSGAVFEIYDGVRDVVRGYLAWHAPDAIAALGWDVSIPYTTRTRSGRLVIRDMRPLAVEADRAASAAVGR